ncbi:MAG TPA: VOC family protein [candidate division Zixibacteria bacterium]|nr:VOC family protein [candidate division Zixibacteria bacterium]
MTDCSEEDIGNILLLEHVNLQVPDQSLATLFYVVGLGLTRDPFLNVGLENMWVNAGEQQFHLPTRRAQVLQGRIGLVFPELDGLKRRLASVGERLKGTRFAWAEGEGRVSVTCPWGNRFECHAAGAEFDDMALGIPWVEFRVAVGNAAGIARFYERVLGAKCALDSGRGGDVARVRIGRNQQLVFTEADGPPGAYDGHHIAIYVANFSGPYGFLKERGLISEDVRNHQFRFQEIVDPESGKALFTVEHEVRSLRHPMFHRALVLRNPEQTTRSYRRGHDRLVPFR